MFLKQKQTNIISQPEPDIYIYIYIFIIGRVEGWISCIYVFMFFSKLLCLFSDLFIGVVCFRLVCLSFCIYNRTNTNKTKTTKLRETKTLTIIKNIKNNNTLFPSRNLIYIYIYIYIIGRVEGWISCMCFCLNVFSCNKVHDNTCSMLS